jgi:MFS superfamily sulfate permease-like transporter
MAAGVLAGVSPVHGLYASIFGPVAGGLTSSSKLMVITTTSAAALAAGSAVSSVPADQRPEALFLLTVLAGGLMIAAAALRLGRLTRFVPHSVMIGFLTGVAVNIILGQLPDLVGSDVSGDFALAKAWHLLLDPRSIGFASLVTGLGALGLLVIFGRSRLRPGPFYAGARGRALLGATSYAVLSDYAARIAGVGGRLYLTGLDPDVLAQVRRNRTVERAGEVRLFEATSVIGEASLDAYRDAQGWLASQP